ncbi:MAG: nucleotidyltransferase domain-containing protein [Magnetococcales bacterium]|nr:nucleotidyltransferase domain-containing protein [Magnetococcales bacterium]
MNNTGLTTTEMETMKRLFSEFATIREVILYGSRAKGSFHAGSDIDLAVTGLENALQAESLAEALEELPLPYRFDVRSYEMIGNAALRDHIDRVGIVLYRRDHQPNPTT